MKVERKREVSVLFVRLKFSVSAHRLKKEFIRDPLPSPNVEGRKVLRNFTPKGGS
jgi:hypothetical protein